MLFSIFFTLTQLVWSSSLSDDRSMVGGLAKNNKSCLPCINDDISVPKITYSRRTKMTLASNHLFLYPLFFQTSRVVQLAVRPRRPRLRDLGQGPDQLARPLSTSRSQNPTTRWNSGSWCHDEGSTGSGHGQTSGRRWTGTWHSLDKLCCHILFKNAFSALYCILKGKYFFNLQRYLCTNASTLKYNAIQKMHS